jgi:hypothetical protein
MVSTTTLPRSTPSRKKSPRGSSLSLPKSTESTTEQGMFVHIWPCVCGRSGTYTCFPPDSVAAVESVQSSGKVCVLDIDVQGVQKVKESSLAPLYLFIAPPSMESLEKRLRGRGTENEEQMQTRLGNAAKELEYGQTPGNFDRVFVNNDLEECFAEMITSFQGWYPHLV